MNLNPITVFADVEHATGSTKFLSSALFLMMSTPYQLPQSEIGGFENIPDRIKYYKPLYILTPCLC